MDRMKMGVMNTLWASRTMMMKELVHSMSSNADVEMMNTALVV